MTARQTMTRYYGYHDFKPGQEVIINGILQSRDCLGVMPTGGGKSLCYQLPALMLPGITVVISPLISLMKDQVDALQDLGVAAAFINSSLDAAELRSRVQKSLQGKYNIIYVAPERLQSQQFGAIWQNLPINLVAIDEAHCVSQWGHDFRPSYIGIADWISSLPQRPVVAAFTATATPRVREDIVRLLGLIQPQIVVNSFDRPNLFYSVHRGVERPRFIAQYLRKNPDQPGIIYAATRREVDNIYDELTGKGFAVGRYHAGLSDQERTRHQDAFIYDRIQVMVATNAFGMGIDKSNVRFVIHHNMPRHLEAYYQEAGRAGRDSQRADCILLYQPGDIQIHKFLIEQGNLNEALKRAEYDKLRIMTDYCHSTQCLRKYILEYFGEQKNYQECGNCANCGEMEERDITISAQKIFSCILRTQQSYGSNLVAEVLKGSKNKRVHELGFDQLSTYGIMKDLSVRQIVDLINLLIAEDYLISRGDRFPVVQLADRARPVLRSQERIVVRFPQIPAAALSESPLFQVLRELRRRIASEQNIAPYMVFSDHTLWEMCVHLPGDLPSLLEIDGVGQVKLEKYGQAFLAAIGEHGEPESSSLKTALNKLRSKFSGKRAKHEQNNQDVDIQPSVRQDPEKKTSSHILTWQEYRQGKSITDISAQREITAMTVENHLLRAAQEGYEVDWATFINAAQEEQVLKAARVAGTERLRSIKEILPADISYFQIKIALLKLSQQSH